MSEAAQAIADLDDELARTGQTVTLRRIVSNGADIIRPGVRAFVRGYTPQELVGGIQYGMSLAVLSPTGLPAEFADTDATRLRRNDRLVIDGRSRNIAFVVPVRMGDVAVRLNVTVEG